MAEFARDKMSKNLKSLRSRMHEEVKKPRKKKEEEEEDEKGLFERLKAFLKDQTEGPGLAEQVTEGLEKRRGTRK